MIELLVMEFILILMRSHEDEAVFSTSYINNSDENFRSLLNYMQMHYQTVTLSKLALAFNYSERQIIRIFKKNTGVFDCYYCSDSGRLSDEDLWRNRLHSDHRRPFHH